MDIKNELSVYNETKKIAVELTKSTLIPSSFKNPADAWYAILYGRELGLGAIYSLNNISVINGKPGLSADAMLGMCMKNPEFGGYSVDKETDDICTITMTRKFPNGTNLTRTVSFTIEEAKKAGLLDTKSQMYNKYPKRMLRARAMAYVCREVFADIFAGTYTGEEMEVIPNKIETPDYMVVEDAASNDNKLAHAMRECQDGIKRLSPDIAAEYTAKAKEALDNGMLDALESLAVEIDIASHKPAPDPAPAPDPEMVLSLKKGIIDTMNKLAATGNYAPKHIINSIKRHIPDINFPSDDWKEAILSSDVPEADLEKALKYWKDRLIDLRKANPPSQKKEETLAEQARRVADKVGTEEAAAVLEEAAELAEGGDDNGYKLIIETWGE